MGGVSGTGVCGVVLKRRGYLTWCMCYSVAVRTLSLFLAFLKDPIERNCAQMQIYICWDINAAL
jgi:hypothetical protein